MTPESANPVDEELWFWRDYLREHGDEVCDRARWKDAIPSRVLDLVESLRVERGRKPRLLELGPGPVSLLAWGVEQERFEMTAIDPLAREYERLMQDIPCSYPVKPLEGSGENLGAMFPPNTFDLAYSSNALDHSSSPRQCIAELAQVVDAGGFIYLECFVREGTNAGWRGLHQHDLVPEDGHLVRYGRDGSRSVVSEGLGIEPVHEQVEKFADRGLSSHGYEWDGNPFRDWREDGWFTLVFAVREDP